MQATLSTCLNLLFVDYKFKSNIPKFSPCTIQYQQGNYFNGYIQLSRTKISTISWKWLYISFKINLAWEDDFHFIAKIGLIIVNQCIHLQEWTVSNVFPYTGVCGLLPQLSGYQFCYRDAKDLCHLAIAILHHLCSVRFLSLAWCQQQKFLLSVSKASIHWKEQKQANKINSRFLCNARLHASVLRNGISLLKEKLTKKKKKKRALPDKWCKLVQFLRASWNKVNLFLTTSIGGSTKKKVKSFCNIFKHKQSITMLLCHARSKH